MTRQAVLVAAGALLGATWGNGAAMMLCALLPLLWASAATRWSAGTVALAYYLVASRGLPFGAGIFFAASAPAWFGWALWLAVAMASAAVWTLAWQRDPAWRALGAPAALVVTALPPIGLVGWTNPLTASGLLYPALGFVGIGFLLLASYFMARRRREALAMFALAAVAANAYAIVVPAPAARGWLGQDTAFRQLQSGTASNLPQRLQLVVELAKRVQPGQVVILPETLLPAADSRLLYASVLLDDADDTLRNKGSAILVGTELVTPGKPRQNVLKVLGDSGQSLTQRVPVPIGMWRPWSADTYAADPLGAGVAMVHGQRIAYSICYEQVLVFPVLRSMLEQPAVLVGAANDWWARDTSVPAIQAQALDAWGRLFAVPVIKATNI